jgi:3-dehydroquinate synthetase
VLSREPAALAQAVARSVAMKADIVAADETEQGRRALLNLGHTFGHALEAETGFGDALLHGEAVAIGMRLAFELAAALKMCPGADAERVGRHFAATELPSVIPRPNGRRFEAAALVRHMRKDKKVRDGRITLILPRRIGEVVITQDVPEDTIAAFLAERIAR